VLNENKDSAKGIATKVVHLLGEWCTVHVLQKQHSPIAIVTTHSRPIVSAGHWFPIMTTDQTQWQCLHDGWWKCNVDASFSQTYVMGLLSPKIKTSLNLLMQAQT
jgi:hypothetical protein